MVAYRTVKLVSTGFKVHFEFGAPTRLYVVGLLLDPVTFDLQGVHAAASVFGPEHVDPRSQAGRLPLLLLYVIVII